LAAGRRVKRPVANLDLVPTLLDFAGVSADGIELEGYNLRRLAAADGQDTDLPEPRHVFSAQGPLQVVTDGRLKLLVDIKSQQRSLFDLAIDPGERNNVAEKRAADVARLSGVLDEWRVRVSGNSSTAERLRDAEAVNERLRALGYLP
jgi:arylsulfatase A-like enzyme